MNISQLATLNSTEPWRSYVEQASWGVLTTASLYLVVVLVMFEVKRGTKSRNTKRRKKWTWSFSENPMCILAAISSLLRCASLQIELSLGTQSDVACQAFMFLNTSLNNLNLLAVYSMLWTRQRALYNNVTLKYLLTPRYRVLNVAVLAGFVVAMVALTSLVFAGLKLVTSPIGCVYVTLHETLRYAISGASFICLVAAQGSLLGLMLYPLFQHYGNTRNCCGGERTIKDRSSKIQNVVTRLCVSTAVCVISDVILGLGVSVYDSLVNPRSILTWLVYNLNMIVNTVALVSSFKDWTARLFPWKRQPVLSSDVTDAGGASSSSVDGASSRHAMFSTKS